MPMLNFRAVTPDHVVDLNRVPDVAGISRAGDTLTIGAMTRQRDIERSDTVRDTLPLLQDALAHVGHR
jgi:carbon-monoxide dehydrogenase medium subunit